MASVMMEIVFMLSEKIKHEDDSPLLSCVAIGDLLAHFLLRRYKTQVEVIRQMEDRHRQLQKAIESNCRRQLMRTRARAVFFNMVKTK